jgi:hypothetical protein
MKNLKQIVAVSVFVALLAVAGSFAQQQGPQSLTTTTLSNAITNVGAGNTSQVTLASISNVYATVSVGTTLWVDTEAMDVVTNSLLANTTTLTVQRGAHGTKAEGHAAGRTVYVTRPNLFQGYDQAGTCWTNATGTQLPTILPWVNITNGNRFNCYSDGIWFKEGNGSESLAITTEQAFCTGIPAETTTVYLNGATCTGATTATFQDLVTTPGELANFRVRGSAVAANANVFTVYKNGVATAITCTVAIAAQTCSDNTHSVATTAGDYIQIQDAVGSTTAETFANAAAVLALYGQ